jgi:hypothetical protein
MMRKIMFFAQFCFVSSLIFSQNNISRNEAIALLHYLATEAYLTQQYNEDSLILEDIFNRLENYTEPGMLDDSARRQFQNIFNRITDFQVQDINREKIRYVRDHARARAIRQAVPSPVFFLSLTNNFKDPIALAVNLVGMAVQSATSYLDANEQSDLRYYEENTVLRKTQKNAVNELRDKMYEYMSIVAGRNGLRDSDTVSRAAIERFQGFKKEPVSLRLENLLRNQSIYEKYMPYWLELANTQCEKGNYQDCLSAIQRYEAIRAPIFRPNCDTDYAYTLTKGIVAAGDLYKDDPRSYTRICLDYLQKIERNIPDTEWSIRYIAALTYMDIASLVSGNAQKREYRDKAYRLLRGNVLNLFPAQVESLNAYLAPIEIPGSADKEQKRILQDQQKRRNTELPPLDEAFYLNYNTLVGVMEQLDISQQEQDSLNEIVHDALLITRLRDDYIRRTKENYDFASDNLAKNFIYNPEHFFSRWGDVKIPTVFLTSASTINIYWHLGEFIALETYITEKYGEEFYERYMNDEIGGEYHNKVAEELDVEELDKEHFIELFFSVLKSRQDSSANLPVDEWKVSRLFGLGNNTARATAISNSYAAVDISPSGAISDLAVFNISDAGGEYNVIYFRDDGNKRMHFDGVFK